MKVMFVPVDPYDPTLSVEDLDDLFEERSSLATDAALDVSSLGEFFSARESFDADFADVFEPPARPALVLVRSREVPADTPAEAEVDAPLRADVHIRVPVEVPAPAEVPVQAEVPVHVEYEAVSTPEPIVSPAPRSSAPDAALTAIQRAVMDFERFAETFHAFARESQGLRTF